MKATAAQAAGVRAALEPKWRLILCHGGDDSASRDIAEAITRQFAGDDPLGATRLHGAALDGDPAALAAAAAAVSMFGDRTLVRVDGAGDDAAPAVAQLLAGPPGNPVVMVAGALKKGSKLLTLAESAADVLAIASYAPEGGGIIAVVGMVAGEFGLQPSRAAATALFDACGGDRGVLRRECEKLALYLDARPGDATALDLDALAAVGADAGEADTGALVSAVTGGRPRLADRQLSLLGGTSGIVLIRAVTRRLFQLATARAAVDAGKAPGAAVALLRPPIFWKETDAVTAQVTAWNAAALAAALARLLAAERGIKTSGSAGEVLARQALLALAQQAARLRS